MQTIGFIGLGIMGKPMAHNLLRAGFPLNIFTRKPEIAASFIQENAKAFASPKELALHSDIIITIVSASADVEEVILGTNGIIQSARPGTIVIDMSTISPTVTQTIAQTLLKKNIHMLDAPVSGGEQGAIDGTLSIMVGGKSEVLQTVQPIFAVLGKKVVHIGGHGAGQVAKLCNQIVIAETIIAVSDALRLAKSSGVDPAKVREALLGGFASSRVLEIHGERMLKNDFNPGFKAKLHHKDMRLALEQAQQLGIDIPTAEYAMKYLNQLLEEGQGDLDSSAIHTKRR